MNKKIVLAITPPFNDNYLPIGIGIVKALIKDKYDVKCMDLRLDLKNKIFSYCDDLYDAEISENTYLGFLPLSCSSSFFIKSQTSGASKERLIFRFDIPNSGPENLYLILARLL